jgi:hypothetical protein
VGNVGRGEAREVQLREAVLYDFELGGRRVRLWKRPGESYEHVLMKALGFAMYVADFPALEIEAKVGLRYKPDLVARRGAEDFRRRRFLFWGECGQTTVRKVGWLVKHADVELVVLFKMMGNTGPLVAELRAAIDRRYLAGARLQVVNFAADVASRAADRGVARVPESWYTKTVV